MVGSPDDFLETSAIKTGVHSGRTTPCNRLRGHIQGHTARVCLQSNSVRTTGIQAFTIIDLLVLVLMVSILIILLAMLL